MGELMAQKKDEGLNGNEKSDQQSSRFNQSPHPAPYTNSGATEPLSHLYCGFWLKKKKTSDNT